MATQISLNRPVALKVLRPDFLTEAGLSSSGSSRRPSAVAKLNHPNIVHVYAIGNIDQVHYIAMEYVEGTNLRDYIRQEGGAGPAAGPLDHEADGAGDRCGRRGRADPPRRQAREHPDHQARPGEGGGLRPVPRQAEEALRLTQSGVTMGTPLYMSPEQAQGHPLDHRSDLYSLGVTYYFMLAGEPPFRADSAVALALKHVREIPRSLLNHRPDLPLEIDRLVMKLMAKDPADRYQSAAMMLADLAKIRELIQVGRDGGSRSRSTARSPAPRRSPDDRPTSWPSGRPSRLRPSPPPPRVRPARPAVRRVEPDRRVRSRRRAPSAGPVQRPDRDGGRGGRLVRRRLAGWSSRAPDVLSIPTEPAGAPARPSGSSRDGPRSPSRPARRSSCDTPCFGPRATSGPRPGSPSRAIILIRTSGLEGLHAARADLVSPGRRRGARRPGHRSWRPGRTPRRATRTSSASSRPRIDLKKGDLKAVVERVRKRSRPRT